jgi:hypothetical protein
MPRIITTEIKIKEVAMWGMPSDKSLQNVN